ncbi:hypothetical protein CSB11_02785 [Candidatus Campbellbacteria bacterium]|nr:MAG: hypothetical protein CSB11_02785 [Candidatus Campbellbacteria bacterium]
MTEKKEKKSKQLCKKVFTKKVMNNVLKLLAFVVVVFALAVAFMYIPLQQLKLAQAKMQIESQRVDRTCIAQANQQAVLMKEQADKNKQEVTEEQLRNYALQQYGLCVYYAGYDLPKQGNSVQSSVQNQVQKTEQKEGNSVQKAPATEQDQKVSG